MAEERYFGAPGVCYDIDGNWWHEPGSVTGEGPLPKPSPRKCCGIVGVDDVVGVPATTKDA